MVYFMNRKMKCNYSHIVESDQGYEFGTLCNMRIFEHMLMVNLILEVLLHANRNSKMV